MTELPPSVALPGELPPPNQEYLTVSNTHERTSGSLSNASMRRTMSSIEYSIQEILYNNKQELRLLHLSCLISSSHNIPTYYATTATHLRQAKLRFNNTTHLQNSQIHFHEFATATGFLSSSPTPNPTNRFPTHLQPLFESSFHLHQPVATLLHSIAATAKKVIVIHDVMMANYVVQDVANVPNAESYGFNPTSPFSSFFDGWQMKGKPFLDEPPPKGLPSLEGCYTAEILNFITLQADFLKFTTGYIYNSCRSIEGKYIDLIAKDEFNKLIWAIEPGGRP
ncbi:zeatin O-glucosyltransferase-like [Rhododendron vialii]|uniref:zeatin O-glucosyltransferase-like n=1 Tax=Rhododendron vialii TaxID=182163 RepID=UPI00265E6B26|nr:zeatin O-glucosyltransferase-like [Rhododendron vialii]